MVCAPSVSSIPFSAIFQPSLWNKRSSKSDFPSHFVREIVARFSRNNPARGHSPVLADARQRRSGIEESLSDIARPRSRPSWAAGESVRLGLEFLANQDIFG